MPDQPQPSLADQILSQMPQGGPQANQQAPTRGNAIGVPTYVIDPSTGFAAVGPDGKPVPWTTQGLAKQQAFNPGIAGIDTGSYQPSIVGARYFEGQEWSEVGGLPPEQRAEIQQAMLDRGLYSSAKPRIALGAWDNDSATAFKQVLAYANAQGIPWNMALKNMPKMDTGADAAGGVKYGPQAPHAYTAFTATLTNPTDLKAVIKAGARSVLGRTLDDSEVSAFVGNYQSAEMADAQARYAVQHENEAARFAAQDAYSRANDEFQQTGTATTPVPQNVETKGGVFTNPALPGNAAEEFARTHHAGEAGAHDIARTFGDFIGLIQGGLAGAQTAGTAGGQ